MRPTVPVPALRPVLIALSVGAATTSLALSTMAPAQTGTQIQAAPDDRNDTPDGARNPASASTASGKHRQEGSTRQGGQTAPATRPPGSGMIGPAHQTAQSASSKDRDTGAGSANTGRAGKPAPDRDDQALPQSASQPAAPSAVATVPHPEPHGSARREATHAERRAAARRALRHDLKQSRFRDTHGSAFQVPTNTRVRVVTDRKAFDWGALDQRQALQGCPPALTKGPNCAPAAPSILPASLATPAPPSAWSQPGWYLRDYDRNQTYTYTGGYLLRMGTGNTVASYVPLLGGALAVGAIWPAAVQSAALPDYYSNYFGLGAADTYRYYDDTLYRVNPQGNAITAVAALLTGNTIAVGKVMPAGYDIYNVPYGYRDQYVDGPDALYRYSDGYIYQLDPKTRMVRAAIEMLD